MRTTCTLPRVMYALETDLSFGTRVDPIRGGDLLAKESSQEVKGVGRVLCARSPSYPDSALEVSILDTSLLDLRL